MATNIEDMIAELLGNHDGQNLYSSMGGANTSQSFALQNILRKAFGLEEINNKRYDDSLGMLKSEFAKSNAGFAADNARLDRVLFSGAADSAGRGAAQGISSLRSALGARGINPSSGAAASLAGRIGMQQQGALMGAARDITADSLRRRDAQRQNRLRQAFGIAEFQNQAADMVGLDALQDVTGVINANRTDTLNTSESSKARSAATKNALFSGIGQFASAALL